MVPGFILNLVDLLVLDQQFRDEHAKLGRDGHQAGCVPNDYGCACEEGLYHIADRVLEAPKLDVTSGRPTLEQAKAIVMKNAIDSACADAIKRLFRDRTTK